MSKASKKISTEVLAFLDKQQLDPTPHNYSMAYYHVTGINPALSRSINDIVGDGFRLTQAEVDALIEHHGLNIGGVKVVTANTSSQDEEHEQKMNNVRHQMLRFADLASNQNEATSQFGRDLNESLAKAENHPEIMALLNAMIERTAAAEQQLAKTVRESEKLRHDLEEARTDANVDALTKIPNRRAIDAMLKDMEKNSTPRIMAFCDVDKFKRINDTYGHAVGDRVLQSVAEILKEMCGEKGTVARWGGEEFVIVFTGRTMAEAASIVDKARIKLTQKTFRLRQTDEPMGMVSFSAGLAQGNGNTADISAAADALLYRAKEEGRNRILTQ